MPCWSRHSVILLVCLALVLPAAPAGAQPVQPAQPAPQQPTQPAPQQPAPPAPQPSQPAPQQPAPPQPYTPPPSSGLPPIPAVPAVPLIGPGESVTLGDAVTTALQKNFTIQTAALQVSLDRATLAQAEAGLLPDVELKGSYTTTSTAASQGTPLTGTITIPGAGITNQPFVAGLQGGLTPQTPPYLFNLTLSYPLYSGNALQDQVTIARDRVQADEAAFAATAGQVVLQARQAYYGVQLAAGQVAAAQRAVDAAQENVRVTGARVRVGTSPQFDLLQAQVQLASSQQSLTQQKAGAVTAHQNLDIVLNLPLTTTITPATPLGLPQPPPSVDELVQSALRQRPELAEARANIAGAQAAIDLARSGLRPNITISGGPGVQTSDPTTHDQVIWQGVIALTLTIFDGGLTKAKVEAAQVQLQQAQVAEQQLDQTIEGQVRTAYLGVQQAAEQLRSAEAGLVAAREALRIANVRFQAGVGTELEVVTAQQNLASADLSVVQAQYNYNLALAQIDQAVGIQVKL